MQTPSSPDPAASDAAEAREIVLGSRQAFEGRRIRVRVDDVRLPSGRESVREVVEHPGAVAIVPLTRDGDLLLIRQYHHSIGRRLLGLPAGTLEPGETPIDTARRELVEETGHEPDTLMELVTLYTSPGYTNERLVLVRADGCRPTGSGPNLDELIHVVPTPLTALPGLLAPGPDQIQDAKTLVGLLWVLRDLGT